MKKNESKEEVEYKQKSGTAWSHSYLNQKPWHPLSYPNQRRKWIAEQQHAQHDRKADEVAREFAQEQEFFRQTAAMSKREKEKVEALQAVGFMYMRPPGYNAESARAAEIADERKKLAALDAPSDIPDDSLPIVSQGEIGAGEPEKKKARRVKDVFGRTVATKEEFPVLKDAPKLDTGVAGRVKPFAIEIRNVKCAKCGAFGHQAGDRECPLKDVITPSETERVKRNDPLNIIIAQATTSDEPFKWELKQQVGAMSPARGGFRPDDPNQQILADDEIYDEYGGFLAGGGDGDDEEGGKLSIPDVLAFLTASQRKELAALRRDERRWKKRDRKHKRKKRKEGSSDSKSRDTDSEDGGRKEKQSLRREKKIHSSDTEIRGGDSENGGRMGRLSRLKRKKKHHSDVEKTDRNHGYEQRKEKQPRYKHHSEKHGKRIAKCEDQRPSRSR